MVSAKNKGLPIAVYIARYILFLVTYLVFMTVAVLAALVFLNSASGGMYKIQTAVPVTSADGKVSSVLLTLDEEQYVQSVISGVKFKLDLSDYEQYMNPSDRDAYITLVNYMHPLDRDYRADDLIDVPFVRSGVVTPYIRATAAKALEAMMKEAYANGCSPSLTVTSAYRTYDYQQSLFDYRVSVYAHLGDEEARRVAATIVAIPGQSEHQFGLAADIHSLVSADTSFEKTFEAKWLAENSWKFGFILRYAEDKTEITKISYEPWHFRYVGRYHAYKIYESGLCLEEYCEQTGLGT